MYKGFYAHHFLPKLLGIGRATAFGISQGGFIMAKKIISIMLAVVIMFTLVLTPTIAYAASNHDPYGYTYADAVTYRTVYKYYSWNTAKKTYETTREFYSKGSYVYDSAGRLLYNSAVASDSKHIGFDVLGNFYIIGNDGSLQKISASNRTEVLFEEGTIRLNYNADELATTVTTTTGTMYLANLNPAPDVDNDDDVIPTPEIEKPKNRVEVYTNSASEQVYEAFYGNKLKTRIIVSSSGSNVLNATAKVRLTDTLKGAKFVGFDSSYNVYLYEGSSLYRFKNGSWFSAQKMQLSGTYKSFQKDEAGFIAKVVTSKNSYTIKQLTTSSKWKASKTYAVHKSNYITMYVKGKTTSYTLSISSGKLKLNGKKIASGVSKYGFVNAKKFIYVKKGCIYTAKIASPNKATRFCKGKTLKTNSVGLVTKVKTSAGKTKKVS